MPFFILLAALAIGFVVMRNTRKTGQGYVNGEPVTLTLGDVPFGEGSVQLRDDAAAAWNELSDAAGQYGYSVEPSGPRAAFRTPEMQQSLIDEEGAYSGSGLAAAVNKSPHQAGIALDVAWDSEEAHQWLVANCHSFGWTNRGDSFTKKEPWHYEYHPELYS